MLPMFSGRKSTRQQNVSPDVGAAEPLVPPSRGAPGTAARGGMATRTGPGLMSRAGGSHPVDENRPMTAVRAAGYTSAGRSNAGAAFDPTGQGGPAARGPAPPLAQKKDNSPEDMCRAIEREVNGLVEESAQLAAQRQLARALDKAKEAGKRERHLCKQREANGLEDQINIDLTYAVSAYATEFGNALPAQRVDPRLLPAPAGVL